MMFGLRISWSLFQQNEDELDEIFEEAIREQRAILYKHHVTQVEVVMPKVEENQLKNRRLVFLDETGVTPEFGVFDEDQVNF